MKQEEVHMSELKAVTVLDAYQLEYNDDDLVYLKSEADRVITRLKTENESLLQQNRELCQALQVMYSKEEYDVLQHALWILRWRQANAIIAIFESKRDSLYYTATGLGPCSKRWVEEYVPNKFVEYKHTPQDWIRIWQDVADRLVKKVRDTSKFEGSDHA